MKNVIFDLDDTLSDTTHRQGYLTGGKKDWDGFFEACDGDAVNEHIAKLFRLYRNNAEYNVHILTGRTNGVRSKTYEWLHTNDLAPSGFLVMRNDGDFRPDHEIKIEMVNEFGFTPENTEIVFDDRESMVNAWREAGFKCAQVAMGKY
ncbi:TPA: hypothetical protein ACQYBV_000604 [Vibrio parahaemolyticus]|nr:hypothetical protein [Vibrio parahaemolyticus]